ncbi:MAG TPA: hypothetical protein DCS87_11625 [Rheinheimera sp.]|nr:hypothetical protein [Rheinheimera sp.]
MITVTPAVASAIAGDHLFAHLLKFEFTGGSTCFTDAGYDITYNGDVYQANGLLLGMEAPKFTNELRVGEISVTFSAADQSVLAMVLNNSQVNRYVHIYRAYLGTSLQVIANPILLHSWLITDASVSSDRKDAEITVSMASEWADFEAPRGRRTTDASQRRFYPNDRGLEFATQVKKDIKWGGE